MTVITPDIFFSPANKSLRARQKNLGEKSSLLLMQLNAQLESSKRMLKLTLKFTLKVILHVSVYNHHQGAYCMCFAKVIIIKIIIIIIIVVTGTTALYEPRPSLEASARCPYSLQHSSNFSPPTSRHLPSRHPPILVLVCPFVSFLLPLQ
jgi:hypothetical protein